MRYIALLRGINVGGNTMIKMSELKKTFESLGFAQIVTYINSGNIAFDTNTMRKPARSKGSANVESSLAAKIEGSIEKAFGKQIAVMIREQEAIVRILASNPFEGQYESHKEMHVLFMNDTMPDEKRDQLLEKQTSDERFVVDGREIFCHLRLGVADSLIGKRFIDKRLRVAITGRNWRTVEKLAHL